MFENMLCHSVRAAAVVAGLFMFSGTVFAAGASCPANAQNPTTKKSETLVEVQVLSYPSRQGRPAADKALPIVHPDQEVPVKGGLKQVWNIDASRGNTFLIECYYGDSNKPVSLDVSAAKQCSGEATTKGTWNGFSCE